ncbi:carboxyl transferase domain-containing protein [Planosporangium mesophilum]|uniref:Acetyl-CoA carboxylase n=1 Tax=Planosporangium mesophilum TaxID=689768 RepID=A0A8J3X1L5_9ACTN|nr:carboxyl transferase domain-containing protein [Planosporangium mesophilum]NJC84379.1 acetyl-CoA carboxyl transferase [Planosporangium mesophilum]GII23479.1 acetyl-CoA carboxylase [Planosporangium mesophilum]
MSPTPLATTALIETVLDPGTWRSWDEPLPDPAELDAAYASDLERARAETGLDESVRTGEGRIGGHRVAVVVCEFAFLGGSIGVHSGERLTRAVERATRERLPLLASPASAGTRMQEGTLAFLQMAKVTAAITDHRAAGLPYLVYLRHPTTGGVLASWGSLGHLTVAEPGALVGFLGPRVYRALYGKPFPPDVQTAENLHAHGLLDGVLSREQLPDAVTRVLDVLSAAGSTPDMTAAAHTAPSPTPAAETIRRSRRPERPTVRALLRAVGRDVTPLSGSGEGEADPGLLLALARIGAVPCVVIGHDHDADRRPRAIGPAGLRIARRGMRLAAELGLPLLSVIDTAGAELSPEAEEHGLAGEIARCLADLITLPTPTLSLLLGEGAGGAALAFFPADRVVAAEHGWLSPLPPEGASEILYRTTDRMGEIADRQRVQSTALYARGAVDRVVAEHPDAADEPAAFLDRIGAVIEDELLRLRQQDPAARLAGRRARYRGLGVS